MSGVYDDEELPEQLKARLSKKSSSYVPKSNDEYREKRRSTISNVGQMSEEKSDHKSCMSVRGDNDHLTSLRNKSKFLNEKLI